jgi:hypothetical protein
MKQHEALYDWPLSEIQKLTDSDQAGIYCETLSLSQQNDFTALTELIRGLGGEISISKAHRQYFSRWSDLRTAIKTFSEKFSTFPDANFSKLHIHSLLAEKMPTIDPIDPLKNISEAAFELREFDKDINFGAFFWENTSDILDSLAAFSVKNPNSIAEEIKLANISPELLYYLITALSISTYSSEKSIVITKKIVPQPTMAATSSFLNMALVSSGRSIHKSMSYTRPLQILDKMALKANHNYQQWSDVILVLSEYNDRKDVLLKFLTLYHVFENLMIKLPIVELERRKAGRMFSIRDFSQLYSQVEGAESKALKRLFTKTFAMEIPSGEQISKKIIERWKNLVPSHTEDDINEALSTLEFKKKFVDFQDNGEAVIFFSEMVYKVRCAIVHNKETELHLTHNSLDSSLKIIICEFLIPVLEEVCFFLIGTPNEITWYNGQELRLFA